MHEWRKAGMKKISLVAIAVVCLVAYHLGQKVASANVESIPTSSVAMVKTAFTATGAKLSEYEVHDWTTLQNKALSLSQLEAIGQKAAMALAISTKPSWTRTTAGESVVMYASQQVHKGANFALQATVELMSMKFPNVTPQTALVIRELVNTTNGNSMSTTYQRVLSAVLATGGQPHLNVTMVGDLSGQLNTSARARVVRHVFACTGGTPLQGMQDAYTTSTSGDVPDFTGPSIRSGRQNLNIQVALHKRDYQKDTKVLVGSPIITIEY